MVGAILTSGREWCLVRVDPARAADVARRIADLGFEVVAPAGDLVRDLEWTSGDAGDLVLADAVFVAYSDDLPARIGSVEGVIAPVLSNAGRIQVIPHDIVEALVAPDGAAGGVGSLRQLRSRLLATSEFYRLDFLLAEVGRLQSSGYRGAPGVRP